MIKWWIARPHPLNLWERAWFRVAVTALRVMNWP